MVKTNQNNRSPERVKNYLEVEHGYISSAMNKRSRSKIKNVSFTIMSPGLNESNLLTVEEKKSR